MLRHFFINAYIMLIGVDIFQAQVYNLKNILQR